MIMTPEGLRLLKEHEGLRLTAYVCPAGVWTVGYGSTRINGRPVREGDTVTEEQAEAMLLADVSEASRAVARAVTVPLTACQRDALVSWVYNVGAGAAERSTLVRRLNAGEYSVVPRELARWNRGGGRVLPGLVRRRADEAALWSMEG